MVNYFKYQYPQPEDAAPFSAHMEVTECPWRTDNRLLKVGLKGREIDRDQRGLSNLVFLLDVSGSMSAQNKLPLVINDVTHSEYWEPAPELSRVRAWLGAPLINKDRVVGVLTLDKNDLVVLKIRIFLARYLSR